MYEGKHTTKQVPPNKPRKTGYLRVFFLWSLVILLILGASGYIYARFLEERIHHNDTFYNKGNKKEVQLPQVTNDEPVSFVLLGSDTRGTPSDPGRSDTLMVFRINPKKKTAYLISIPRDSRVEIPGYGKQKINAAYELGGPELVIKTVERLTGLEINHYVVVDFQGFKDIIDALGGIDINVKKKIRDHFDGNYVSFNPGMHHFNGQEALEYVRVRHVDDDFGRMGRQQQFLRAVMDKLTRFSNVWKIPELVNIASHNIGADSGLGIKEMISYAGQMKSIGRKNIHMITLPPLSKNKMIDGLSYVILDQQKVAWIVGRVKNDMPLELTAEEKQNASIKIAVKNGSGKPGVAKEMADKLASLSFKIGEINNAKSFDYNETQIVAPPDKVELAQRVRDQLGLGRVVTKGITSNGSDVLVIVGQDFASSRVNQSNGTQN